MSNRFPVSDEQIIKTKNTMKKALAKIEHLNTLLKDYEGNVSITLTVALKDLKQFAKQENLTIYDPSNVCPYYWAMFRDGKVLITFQTEELKQVTVWK